MTWIRSQRILTIKGVWIFMQINNQQDNINMVQRMPDDIILTQIEFIIKTNHYKELFDFIPVSILIFDEEMRIVYTNQHFLDILGLHPNNNNYYGTRIGDIINCVHINKSKDGCGSEVYCNYCNIVRTVYEARVNKQSVKREFKFQYFSKNDVEVTDFLVFATPSTIINENYTICIIKNNSLTKQKEAIERVFFHDLLNTSGAIKGLLECAKQSKDMDELLEIIDDIDEITEYMIEEIENQKDFVSALDGRLQLDPTSFSLTEVIKKCTKRYMNYYSKVQCNVEEEIIIHSDKILVMRVLNNMIKNACENAKMKTVTVSANVKNEYVEVLVNNQCYIPEHIQKRIFDSYFSTKGSGHGLGTSSMKLLGEKYLNGYIRFETTKEDGTTFIFGIPKGVNSI